MEQQTITHKEISLHLEQAEVRLLHPGVTQEEIEDAKTHILFALGIMKSEYAKLDIK